MLLAVQVVCAWAESVGECASDPSDAGTVTPMTTSDARAGRGRIISALLAGFIAGFVWMAITVLIGGFGTGAVVGGGVAFLVGGAVITYFIDTAISRSHG